MVKARSRHGTERKGATSSKVVLYKSQWEGFQGFEDHGLRRSGWFQKPRRKNSKREINLHSKSQSLISLKMEKRGMRLRVRNLGRNHRGRSHVSNAEDKEDVSTKEKAEEVALKIRAGREWNKGLKQRIRTRTRRRRRKQVSFLGKKQKKAT